MDRKMSHDISRTLDLNAGYFGLGKLISLDRIQQEHLLNISDLVYNYAKQKSKTRPLNIYIEAFPGSGKSYFVDQVINSVKDLLGDKKFVSKTYNLTCVNSTEELGGAFRLIQSINIEGMLPIVFFDEIDYPINDKFYSYPFFLAPMFDGKIYESGNDYNIGSAILFFAASRKIYDIVKGEDNGVLKKHKFNFITNKKKRVSYEDWYIDEKTKLDEILSQWDKTKKSKKMPNKIKDFLDRIDEFVFLPPANIFPNGEPKDRAQQAAYIAAAFIKKHFPKVKITDNWTITLLAKQVYEYTSYRNLDSVIFKSSPPTDRHFKMSNLPFDFKKKNEEFIEREIKQKRNRLVQINS